MTPEKEVIVLKAQLNVVNRQLERAIRLIEKKNEQIRLLKQVASSPTLPQSVATQLYENTINEVALHCPAPEGILNFVTKYVDDYLLEYSQRRY